MGARVWQTYQNNKCKRICTISEFIAYLFHFTGGIYVLPMSAKKNELQFDSIFFLAPINNAWYCCFFFYYCERSVEPHNNCTMYSVLVCTCKNGPAKEIYTLKWFVFASYLCRYQVGVSMTLWWMMPMVLSWVALLSISLLIVEYLRAKK